MRPLKTTIDQFFSSKGIAVYGFSTDKNKFGTYVYRELSQKGYPVFAMHPTEKELHGIECFNDLLAINTAVDAAFICVGKEKVVPVLKALSERQIKKVWLQQGAESEAAFQFAKNKEMTVISKECIMMFAKPVAFPHRIHGFLKNVFSPLKD